jgi:hypothetical protein
MKRPVSTWISGPTRERNEFCINKTDSGRVVGDSCPTIIAGFGSCSTGRAIALDKQFWGVPRGKPRIAFWGYAWLSNLGCDRF